jgi:central kinetochore subunit Mal2/MCM21
VQKHQTRAGTRQTAKQARDDVIARIEAQRAHDQQCLYRLGASVTTFKVRDPDPHAVDNGVVLGLRFDVMTSARYLHPYFVFLNRPWASERGFFRVHRHTVPPCIPLSGLAARHLPAPKKRTEDDTIATDQPRQDLVLFVRTLRREMVRYHNRVGAMADIRRGVGLAKPKANETAGRKSVVDVRAIDPEAKQVRLEWSDGRSGRIVMDDDGKVTKAVVFGPRGRDRETARALFEHGMRVEDVAGKLQGLAAAEAEASQLDDDETGQSEDSQASVAS